MLAMRRLAIVGAFILMTSCASAVAHSAPTPVSPTPVAIPREDLDYLAFRADQMAMVHEAFLGIGLQSRALGKNPQLLGDPDWQTQTLVYLGEASTTGSDLQVPADAPPDLVDVDRHFAVLGRELVSLADGYSTGIGGPDKTLLSHTIVHLRDVADEIASIDEGLNAVKAKYKLAQSG